MRRIVILGFMGSGKTTVANALALRLGCHMVDLDSFIFDRTGFTPAEIIQGKGAAEFRDIETTMLRTALQTVAADVIALGGGAWTIAKNRELLAQYDCLTVWLDAPFELCWERIAASRNATRPLAPDQSSALELYQRRRSSYELADFRLEGNVNTDQSVELILTQVQGHD